MVFTWVKELVSFGIIGSIGMVIDFGLTFLLREKARMNEYAANAIGFLLAVTNNYFFNKFFTFHDFTPLSLKQFSMFLLISIIGLSLNSLFLFLLQRLFKIKFYWAKLFATGLVFMWNFIVNSFITFSYVI